MSLQLIKQRLHPFHVQIRAITSSENKFMSAICVGGWLVAPHMDADFPSPQSMSCLMPSVCLVQLPDAAVEARTALARHV